MAAHTTLPSCAPANVCAAHSASVPIGHKRTVPSSLAVTTCRPSNTVHDVHAFVNVVRARLMCRPACRSNTRITSPVRTHANVLVMCNLSTARSVCSLQRGVLIDYIPMGVCGRMSMVTCFVRQLCTTRRWRMYTSFDGHAVEASDIIVGCRVNANASSSSMCMRRHNANHMRSSATSVRHHRLTHARASKPPPST
jgi:hypothetical protein